MIFQISPKLSVDRRWRSAADLSANCSTNEVLENGTPRSPEQLKARKARLGCLSRGPEFLVIRHCFWSS